MLIIINENETLKELENETEKSIRNVKDFFTKNPDGSDKMPMKIVKINFSALKITGELLLNILKKLVAIQRDEFSDYSAFMKTIRDDKINTQMKKGVSLDVADYKVDDLKLFKKAMKENHVDYIIQKYGHKDANGNEQYSIFFRVQDTGVFSKALETYEKMLEEKYPSKTYQKESQKEDTNYYDKNNEKDDLNEQKKNEFERGEKDTDLDGVPDRVDVDKDNINVSTINDLNKREKGNTIQRKNSLDARPSMIRRLFEKKDYIAEKNEDKDKNRQLKKEKSTPTRGDR